MGATKHSIMGGKVHVYKRPESPIWQCSTYLAGKNRRVSTKETGLAAAKDFAEDWYLELVGKKRDGTLGDGVLFQEAAKHFLREFDVLTEGSRNRQYVAGHERRVRLYLNPFFGKTPLPRVTAGMIQDYRVHRMSDFETKPAVSTLHQEMVALRQILKLAVRRGWMSALPDMTVPYRGSWKISHRAWFSPEEYRKLYTATRARIQSARSGRDKAAAERIHDKVLFLANTGLRPDELKRLEYRDVTITDEYETGEPILEISVRGKRGVGYCKSMPGAVRPFRRMLDRNNPSETDLLFPTPDHRIFNSILEELDLKHDRDGNPRTWYSLRHSYISFRLLEGADIYQIAKNCRTSVEMIEKHYAVHLQNSIDARAVNVRRSNRP